MVCVPLILLTPLYITFSTALIHDLSPQIQDENLIHVSSDCGTDSACMSFDAFTEHPYSWMLFYAHHTQTSASNYKSRIINAFHQVCQGFRHTNLTCSIVDIVRDESLVRQYIDPKTAPAHLFFKRSHPQQLPQDHVAKLMKSPGDVRAMKWHVQEMWETALRDDERLAEKKKQKKKKKEKKKASVEL